MRPNGTASRRTAQQTGIMPPEGYGAFVQKQLETTYVRHTRAPPPGGSIYNTRVSTVAPLSKLSLTLSISVCGDWCTEYYY
jgi:vacuolar-type H+-ATPase catalytic subunit A/Vma1